MPTRRDGGSSSLCGPRGEPTARSVAPGSGTTSSAGLRWAVGRGARGRLLGVASSLLLLLLLVRWKLHACLCSSSSRRNDDTAEDGDTLGGAAAVCRAASPMVPESATSLRGQGAGAEESWHERSSSWAKVDCLCGFCAREIQRPANKPLGSQRRRDSKACITKQKAALKCPRVARTCSVERGETSRHGEDNPKDPVFASRNGTYLGFQTSVSLFSCRIVCRIRGELGSLSSH